MVKQNLREASKSNWQTDNQKPMDEEIQIGALQRIADATEKMAEGFTELYKKLKTAENDVNYLNERLVYYRNEGKLMARRINALRGVITRIKKSKHK